MRFSLLTAGGLLYAASLVAAHSKITNAVGDQGGKAVAFGIQKGSGNSQDDVTNFKQGGTFGKTTKGQAIDPAKDLAAVQAQAGNTLPQVAAGGSITLTLHQNNGDGAGPYDCSVDVAAAGKFAAATITTDVPGNNGNSGANDQDFPLVVAIGADIACAGTLGSVANVCLIKCQNPGGFGGLVAFQISAGGGKAAAGGNGKGKGGGKKNARRFAA